MKELALNYFKELNELLSADPNYVLWVRSLDYHQQIYVSPGYQLIWGRSCSELYQNPNSWGNWLLENQAPDWMKRLLQKKPALIQQYQAYYAVKRDDARVNFIRDQFYFLTDEQHKQVAVAGIAKKLSEREWEAERDNANTCTDKKSEDLIKNFESMLKPSLISIESNNKVAIHCEDKLVYLTKRELTVLHYVLQGNTAKAIAEMMSLSSRTIETYIENIKNKFYCRNKFDLFRKINLKEVQDKNLTHAWNA